MPLIIHWGDWKRHHKRGGILDKYNYHTDEFCSRLSPRSIQLALAYVEVYLYNSIGVFQGGP